MTLPEHTREHKILIQVRQIQQKYIHLPAMKISRYCGDSLNSFLFKHHGTIKLARLGKCKGIALKSPLLYMQHEGPKRQF